MSYPTVEASPSHFAQFKAERHKTIANTLKTVNDLLKQRGDWYRARYGKPFIPHFASPVEPDSELAMIEASLGRHMPGVLITTEFDGTQDAWTKNHLQAALDKANQITNELRGSVSVERRAELAEEMNLWNISPALIVSSPDTRIGTKIIRGQTGYDHSAIYNHLDPMFADALCASGFLIGVKAGSSLQTMLYFIPQVDDLSSNVWVSQEVLTAEEVATMKGGSRRMKTRVSDLEQDLYRQWTNPRKRIVKNTQVTLPVYRAGENGLHDDTVIRAIMLSPSLNEVRIERFTAHERIPSDTQKPKNTRIR